MVEDVRGPAPLHQVYGADVPRIECPGWCGGWGPRTGRPGADAPASGARGPAPPHRVSGLVRGSVPLVSGVVQGPGPGGQGD